MVNESWEKYIKEFIQSQDEYEIMRGYGYNKNEWMPLGGILRRSVHKGWEYTLYKEGKPLWSAREVDSSTMKKLLDWDRGDLYSVEQQRMMRVYMHRLGYKTEK